MRATILLALVRKELLALGRDMHALVSLFLMPVLFIIIMSLALKDVYSPKIGNLPYAIDQQDQGELGSAFTQRWTKVRGTPQASPATRDAAIEQLRQGKLRYLIVIERGFSEDLASPQTPKAVRARVIADPALEYSIFRGTEAELAAMVGELRAEALQERFTGISREGGQSIRLLVAAERLAFGGRPTAVQQNVPAWLVFGMFFVLSAIASLLVQEHDNGTLSRLISLGVSPLTQLAAKGLPYLGVNALQAALMLAVGVWAMPLFGSDGLSLAGINWLALIVMITAISLAAIGMALALASLMKTHAQASTIGPVVNVLLAAIGGVMVPRFIMPPFMQDIAALSPMNWALEGLLAVILRHASVAEIGGDILRLALFGVVMLALATFLFSRRTRA
ncbi:ABC transporter permease [Viridibacterium curvum]|uniref:ABC transporter permease n=1 Tax=Viridibacterium curvum TaxID=1101404 RepID=A0ABP9R203_9RHOO